nr:hypothetical protein [uncultured Azospirillum sp.]
MAVRKPKDDMLRANFMTELPATGKSANPAVSAFEPKPATSKADFDERLTKVMGKISKTRAYLAK